MTNDGFELDELRTAVILDEHDGVAEVIDGKDEQITEYEDRIDSLEDETDSLEDEVDTLEDTVDSYKAEVRDHKLDHLEDLIDRLTDITDTWDAEDLRCEEDADLTAIEDRIDTVDERIEIVKDVGEEVATPDNNVDNEGENGPERNPDGSVDLRRQTKIGGD